MENNEALITFDDICISSQYSEIKSRNDVDISTMLDKIKLRLPVISANMPDITESKMAIEIAMNGGFGIIHRFMSIEDNIEHFKKAKLGYSCGVSIGVNENEKERFNRLYEEGARIFCIDIAHGHCKQMKDMIEWIKNKDTNVCLICGNIATKEAAIDLMNWGASIAKVGIGPGFVCRTRSNTGVGKPQFSALKEIYEAFQNHNKRIPIISDGGIKTAGDVAKALIYADAVMVGAVLSGTIETPGNVYADAGTNLTNRTYYKLYGGSSSAENKNKNGQKTRFVEGEMKKIPFKGHVKYLLREIEDGLKSALSYSGAKNLKEYKEKVQWYEISSGGKSESKF